MRRRYRLSVLASHPVQYQVPLWRALAKHPAVELTVFYGTDFGVGQPVRAEFGAPYRWNIPLLEGYTHRFLANRAPRPSLRGFFGIVPSGLGKALREAAPDALLLLGYSRASDWMALALARRMRIPVLLRAECSSLLPPSAVRSLRRALITRRFLERVDAFLPIGTACERFYRQMGIPQAKLFLSPYAVDNSFFRPPARPQKEALRFRLRLPPDRVIFLSVGTLIPRKRPLDLLEAYRRMKTLRRSAVVWVGDGELRGRLEQASRGLPPDGKFFLAGFQNQTELRDYYAAADVFVLPSREEVWGLVVNEAMNSALPIVVSDKVSAALDLVERGVNGSVYPVGDTRELAREMEEMMDGSRRTKFGEASLSKIECWGIPESVEGAVHALEATLE